MSCFCVQSTFAISRLLGKRTSVGGRSIMLNCLKQIHCGVDVGGRTCRTHRVPNKRLLICFARKRRRARLGSRPIRNRLARLDVRPHSHLSRRAWRNTSLPGSRRLPGRKPPSSPGYPGGRPFSHLRLLGGSESARALDKVRVRTCRRAASGGAPAPRQGARRAGFPSPGCDEGRATRDPSGS